MSKEEELKQKAEDKADKRRKSDQILGKLFNDYETTGAQGMEVMDAQHSKEVELNQTAEKFEQKRKITGEWLAKSKGEEKN